MAKIVDTILLNKFKNKNDITYAKVDHSHTLDSLGVTVDADDINKLDGITNNIQEQINSKVNKPANTGSTGQVLESNGDGTTSWVTRPKIYIGSDEMPEGYDIKFDPNVEPLEIDTTLSIEGALAEAKATGDAINELQNLINSIDVNRYISAHNVATDSHVDIRNLVTALQEALDALSNGAVAENTAAIEQIIQGVNMILSDLQKADSDTNVRIDELKAEVGDLEELETTSKTDLVGAINEVKDSVATGSAAAAIAIVTDATTSNALKSYTIKQGGNTIGTIDIPKDMVVESGEVVTNPAGQTEGTYIKLVLTNVSDPLYINVGTLVDIYKAASNAAQIQIAIDSSTREISATIVAGSVGTTELVNSSVTTVKIADANVTLAKLSTAIQASLAKADSAVQTINEGSTNGTISVDGTDVAVHGLGSAAFTDSSAFDASGSANAVQDKLDEEVARAKAAEAQMLVDAKNLIDQKTQVQIIVWGDND